jgi:hypothetical protein
LIEALHYFFSFIGSLEVLALRSDPERTGLRQLAVAQSALG